MAQVVAAMPEQSEDFCTYSSTKLDDQVLPLAKAAAALAGMAVQDWLSDIANDAASKVLGRKPIRRRPVKRKGD